MKKAIQKIKEEPSIVKSQENLNSTIASKQAESLASAAIESKNPVEKPKSFFSRFFSRKTQSQSILSAQKIVEAISTKAKNKLDRKIRDKIKTIEDSKKKKKKFTRENFSERGLIKAVKLEETLIKAGFEDKDPRTVARSIMIGGLGLGLFAVLFILIKAFIDAANMQKAFLFAGGMFFVALPIGVGIVWVCYLFYLDMKIFNRTKEVEKVFPDFLQLASSNISAGMPIDRALWYAVRPNFGVLAKEIENVAKNTLAGQDLSDSLTDFAKKYDSKVIQRSVNLLLVGLSAGGELADLLSKIAIDIEETRILKKDMAANVTTYVIFITFASIVAAPALLGLSTQLLEVITKITASVATESPASSGGFMSISFTSNPSTVKNFRTFAFLMLFISSFFAAAIVSVIQKGNMKEGLSKIPIFILVSLAIYMFSNYVMSMMFVGLI